MLIRTRPVPKAVSGFTNDLLERVFAARGVRAPDEVEYSLAGLLHPTGLPHIDVASQRLIAAITQQEKILIVGDFDADGATSVTLCVLALQAMGARHVDFIVPNRFDFGYGLSPEIVALAQQREPDLIVTVDNGVASIDGVAFANAAGIDVIVTDHHLPGQELPAAVAVVNPNLDACDFASKSMAGVGVAYYLLSYLRSQLRAQDWFAKSGLTEPNMAQYLDLVALGTVADVVPLDRNNRILVHQGLSRMRRGRLRPGLRLLIELGKRNLGKLSAQDLAFAVGPRLNAAGRLDDMTVGIRCLLAETAAEAKPYAGQLEAFNASRREIEQDMVSDAELMVAEQDAAARDGITAYHPSFHQGVVGIVAGRLREKFNRPAVVFADVGESSPGELKGSARSIDGLHIRDVLDRIATTHPGMLIKFGGHAMAAGLSIKRIHYQRFQTVFDKQVSAWLTPEMAEAHILTDGALNEADLSLDTVELLAQAGPWGSGFPEPLFSGEFELISQRVVGQLHLKMVVKTAAKLIDAIAFRQAALPAGTDRVMLAYRPDCNDYQNSQTLQLLVEYIEPLT